MRVQIPYSGSAISQFQKRANFITYKCPIPCCYSVDRRGALAVRNLNRHELMTAPALGLIHYVLIALVHLGSVCTRLYLSTHLSNMDLIN